MFPGADKQAQSLLFGLLMFDVDKRVSVDQALEHPYLKAVRDPAHERAKNPGTFSFESAQLGSKKLRELILEEVLKYNKYDEPRLIQSGAMPNYKRMMERKRKEKEAQQQKEAKEVN